MGLNYKALGARVREKRLKKGYTQDKLADLTGVSNPHISNIERGQTKVSLPTLVDIANVLDTTVDELLCNNLKQGKVIIDNDIKVEIEKCNERDTKILYNVVKAVAQSLKEID
jgi:transcriptional regulator with XRE-family HTH domain